MTINEAKTKWCPMARVRGVGSNTTQNRKFDGGGEPDTDCYCIAADCMMWREYINPIHEGFCGLAGKDTWQEKR
jgi:hypothetical protein